MNYFLELVGGQCMNDYRVKLMKLLAQVKGLNYLNN